MGFCLTAATSQLLPALVHAPELLPPFRNLLIPALALAVNVNAKAREGPCGAAKEFPQRPWRPPTPAFAHCALPSNSQPNPIRLPEWTLQELMHPNPSWAKTELSEGGLHVRSDQSNSNSNSFG